MFIFTAFFMFLLNNYAVDLVNAGAVDFVGRFLEDGFDDGSSPTAAAKAALIFLSALAHPALAYPAELCARDPVFGAPSFRIFLFFMVALVIVCALVGAN